MAGFDNRKDDSVASKAKANVAEVSAADKPAALNLLQLQDNPNQLLPKSAHVGIVQAQDVLNRNKSGPVGNGNIYHAQGAGVASAFHKEDGSHPQDAIPATAPTNSPGTKAWPQQQVEGLARLRALADENKNNIQNTLAPPRTDGVGFDGRPLHGVGPFGPLEASGVVSAYGQWGHPLMQRALIPGQLTADADAAAGKLSETSKILGAPRKAYLETFSSVYQVQAELAKIVPQEDLMRKELQATQTTARENLEVLQARGQALKDIQNTAKLTVTSSTPAADAAEIARAQRQMSYLTSLGKGAKGATTAALKDKIAFLENHADYVGSTSKTSLNWKNFSEAMDKSNLFKSNELEAAAQLAAKEEPYVAIGGKIMGRQEMEQISKGIAGGEGAKGILSASNLKGFGAKFLGSAAIVVAESHEQSQLAESLAGSGHTSLAAIVEPNVGGLFAKTAAIVLTPTKGLGLIGAVKSTAPIFLGAQLYEAESNMTHFERGATTLGGLGIAGALKLAGKGKLATTVAIADLAIGIASELTDDFFLHNDHTTQDSKKALATINANPDDFSQSTLNKSVQENVKQGMVDPFFLTQHYDNARSLTVTDDDDAFAASIKYKTMMVMEQAQGEVVLNNGMTKSQFLKMQDPKAKLLDPDNKHREEWKLCPNERIDIGGQGAKALIQSVIHADLLQSSLAEQGKTDDIAQVELQKKSVKAELDNLFNQPHPKEMENALQKNMWVNGSNKYNLTEMWEASGFMFGTANGNFDYAHLMDTIKAKADLNEKRLPNLQQSLDNAQQELAAAKASNQPASKIAMNQKRVQASQDELDLTTAYIAKLYRDQALMKLGQVQSDINKYRNGKTIAAESLNAQLLEASKALGNAQRLAPNNRDLAQLGAITGSMSNTAKQISTRSFQPNR